MSDIPDELRETVRKMRDVQDQTYWVFFRNGMGSCAHAFIEFNGLISKYVDVCERAVQEGVDFRHANIHNNQPLPVQDHDLLYLAEKLRCIFGPIIDANPKAKELFLKELSGE